MSHVIDEDETYTYEILQQKQLEESTRLLAIAFTKYNPREVYMKTTYEQFYSPVLEFSKAILNEKLSVVAIQKETKETHGLVEACDAKKLKEQQFADSEPSIDTEVFIELERRFMKQYGEPSKESGFFCKKCRNELSF
jgi:hypothetical protein